jgi:hypothetical protein
MIKRIFAIITAAAFLLSAAACSMMLNPTQKYLMAFTRFMETDSCQEALEGSIRLDLSKASEKAQSELKQFKDIKFNLDSKVDGKNKKSEFNAFITLGETIMNTKLYADGGILYMQAYDREDQFIRFNSAGGTQGNADHSKNFAAFEQLFHEMGGIWKNSIEKEILSSSGNSIEHTPDGDIKVTILSLELTDEKSKRILELLVETAVKNQAFTDQALSNAVMSMQNGKTREEKEREMEKAFTEFPETLRKVKDKYTLEKLQLQAKVDSDNNIIDQTLDGTIVIKSEGELRIDFHLHSKKWNINSSSVKVVIPTITNENTIDSKDYDFNSMGLEKH